MGAVMEGALAETKIRRRFQAIGKADDARWQKAYMKSELAFHGVPSAEVKAAARELLADHADADHTALVATVDHLFSSAWFDVRSVGVVVLERKRRLLGTGDLEWLIDLVRRGACWAHVDTLATNVIGFILTGDAPTRRRSVTRWARDDLFWVRRTALLSLERELAHGEGDLALFERVAAPMLTEKEFFIRKAIGWVLRSTSKKRPDDVHRFLMAHREETSGLTLREGAKYLPLPMRRELGLSPVGPRAKPSRSA